MKYTSAFDFFFFFQAEDGIRGPLVTGVQTCALPISPVAWLSPTLRALPGPALRARWVTRNRGSAVALASRIWPQASGDASSTAITSMSGGAWPSTESRHASRYSGTPYTGSTMLIRGSDGMRFRGSALLVALPAGLQRRVIGAQRDRIGNRLSWPRRSRGGDLRLHRARSAHPGWPPVPSAQENHGGGHEQRSDQERVHQDAQRQAEGDVAELAAAGAAARDEAEDDERAGQHQPGGGHRGAGRRERTRHCVA